MPVAVQIGKHRLIPSHGNWLTNTEDEYSSLIEAYASVFGGRMTLLDLASSIEQHDITLDDFVLENSGATLEFLRQNWIYTYVSIISGYRNGNLENISLDRVDANFQALRAIRESVSSKLYPEIACCLTEAVAQFEALLLLGEERQAVTVE